jgi:gluconolactonase
MTIVANSPRMHELVSPDAELEEIGSGFTFTEGPVWHKQGRFLLFSDMPGDVRRRYSDADGVTEVARPSNKGNGMTYDLEGRLLICEHSTSLLVRVEEDGSRTTLASHYDGKELNSPNDVIVKKDGTIFFSDPWYGRMPVFGVERERELDICGVYKLPAGGGELELAVGDFEMPNGLCFSPDESILYINDTARMHIRKFGVNADGSLSGGDVWFVEEGTGAIEDGIPDGMKCDEHGNVYVSGPGGVWVISPDGEDLGRIQTPENVGNLCFGDDDLKTLYITTSSTLQRIRLNVAGDRVPHVA